MSETRSIMANNENLTFKFLRGLVPRHNPDEIEGMRDERGNYTQLACLLSDQCPFGITIATPDGELRVTGSVLSHVQRAKEFISKYNPKRVVEGSKSPVDRFPRVALNEAILNAVVHRDYTDLDDISITILPDSIRVISPGAAWIGPGWVRNPGLVEAFEMFRLKGYQRGGMYAISKAYSRSGYEPRMVNGKSHFLTILPAVEHVSGFYEGKVERLTRHMSECGGVTTDDVSRILRISKTYTFRVLDRMEREGVVFSMYAGSMRRFFLCNKHHGKK